MLKQRRTLVTTTRLFEYFLTAHRKFLDSFIKSFSSKHESLSEYSSCILVSFFFKSVFLLFLTYTLIGMACGHDSFTFIWLLPVRACSRYSKKSVTVSCLSISEKGDHTTQKSNYISGKWKELKFRKWSIKWCWNILTKYNLLRWNFLSNCTKKFSRGSMEDKSK